MLTERIRARAKDARMIGTGYVAGRRLTFQKIGTRKNGSKTGKCDISADDLQVTAYGVLYEIPEEQFEELNTHEKGYSIAQFVVHSGELGTVSAIAHVADNTDPTLVPYDWYHSLVLAGAREHGLPESHIHGYIENVAVEQTDSTYEDARKAKELLERIRNKRTADPHALQRTAPAESTLPIAKPSDAVILGGCD